MSDGDVAIFVIGNLADYTDAQISEACWIWTVLARGRLVLAPPPART